MTVGRKRMKLKKAAMMLIIILANLLVMMAGLKRRKIIEINNNGTVRIKMGCVDNTYNIRNIKPYYD